MGDHGKIITSEFDKKWIKEINIAVTICDRNGKLVYMNDKSVKTFENDGGVKLLGTNILDCHPEPSRTFLSNMLQNEKENVYTISKNGIKKMILQLPCYSEDKYSGFAEFSFEIPEKLNHFNRD
jgi:transcriptional regulator with PAS, ATPase and Fis domain